ncbi:hypothetical protein DPEC_G00300130 [Dallia pectoralis]|uniref:Uncharacterized protein n=1 Tax=Dallia pectoralis TaxID=75939 RepID=A0ACC2FGG3_DALPE|nr:hypothetical protein DPEC_G00300130 [Dallia pectoralis]
MTFPVVLGQQSSDSLQPLLLLTGGGQKRSDQLSETRGANYRSPWTSRQVLESEAETDRGERMDGGRKGGGGRTYAVSCRARTATAS